ncbi:MAG: C-type lectin domain-containing protein [Alphaproteobacteria bacterium]|nr:C-type lectin domain-containing protein [Alphaproteobacteria bacterium]
MRLSLATWLLAGCGPVERFGGSEYVFSRRGESWTGARDDCASRGFHLADILDADEDAWVSAVSLVYGEDARWIGLNDRAEEGTWVWESGAVSAYSSLDMYPSPGADCAVIVAGQPVDTGLFEVGWQPARCPGTRPYICERLR